MKKASEVRKADHPIELALLERWSPRAMTGEPIPMEELLPLFEAARWAPSSGNAQPWRLLYARRETEQWPLFFDLLMEGNKLWVKNAALLVLFISRSLAENTGKPSVTHSFDTGAAWENFALQGNAQGLVVHGMQGFDYEKAKTVLQIPEYFRVEAMVAVGRSAPLTVLPEALQAREVPSDRRKLKDSMCEGVFRL